MKNILTSIVISAIAALIVVGPAVIRDYNHYTETQHELMQIELESLKSGYGVCDVLNKSNRKDLQDIMRDVCDKNLVRQAELNKMLGI